MWEQCEFRSWLHCHRRYPRTLRSFIHTASAGSFLLLETLLALAQFLSPPLTSSNCFHGFILSLQIFRPWSFPHLLLNNRFVSVVTTFPMTQLFSPQLQVLSPSRVLNPAHHASWSVSPNSCFPQIVL